MPSFVDEPCWQFNHRHELDWLGCKCFLDLQTCLNRKVHSILDWFGCMVLIMRSKFNLICLIYFGKYHLDPHALLSRNVCSMLDWLGCMVLLIRCKINSIWLRICQSTFTIFTNFMNTAYPFPSSTIQHFVMKWLLSELKPAFLLLQSLAIYNFTNQQPLP